MGVADLFKKGRYRWIILGVVLFIGVGFYFWSVYGWRMGVNFSCVQAEERNITGSSMAPLLIEGQKVKSLEGYYNCNEIKKGQIVILEFKSREESFVKNIAGVPGDKIEFSDNQIKLNGKILKNVAGEPYLFSEQSQKIINIPLKNGVIPEGRYLILSEEKSVDSFDSRQFGFVQVEHLKGRVIK